MSDRYAVIGNPVAHSKSPQIHAAFAAQTGQDLVYERLEAPLDAFEAVAQRFFDAGGRGLNVTVPFKQEAWRMVRCDEAHPGGAALAEAVNTIRVEGGRLVGYNTDGIGLVADIEHNLGRTVAGRRLLVLGAGGATRGVLRPLLERSPQRLVLANRTLDKATLLAGHFGRFGAIEARPFAGLAGLQFDLVINATSAGLSGEMPPLPQGLFASGALGYDMVYGRDTPFLAFARQQGAQAADGLGMLVEQAAESFYIWRGLRPQTAPVIARLRGGG